MGVYRYNPLREAWIETTEQWLKNKGCGSSIYTGTRCPRCGLKLLKSDLGKKSQYAEYAICEVCREDEMLRDSVGSAQMDLSEWFSFSRGKEFSSGN